MNPHLNSKDPIVPVPRQSFLQKLGAGSLSISLLIHAALLIVGVIWVIQVVTPEEKIVDFIPNSGGGAASAHEMKTKELRSQTMQTDLARISAFGAASRVMLPEPEGLSPLASLGGLSTGSLFSGFGKGGAPGDGFGAGLGSGLVPGMNDGRGSKNLFGMQEKTSNGLAGTFYDLKQTDDLKPTDMTADEMREILKDVAKRGFKSRDFAKYYKAPTTLYQTKFLIPSMPADQAPAAFSVEKYVQPKQWFVVYRGTVQA